MQDHYFSSTTYSIHLMTHPLTEKIQQRWNRWNPWGTEAFINSNCCGILLCGDLVCFGCSSVYWEQVLKLRVSYVQAERQRISGGKGTPELLFITHVGRRKNDSLIPTGETNAGCCLIHFSTEIRLILLKESKKRVSA